MARQTYDCCDHCLDPDATEPVCADAPHVNHPCPQPYCPGGDTP